MEACFCPGIKKKEKSIYLTITSQMTNYLPQLLSHNFRNIFFLQISILHFFFLELWDINSDLQKSKNCDMRSHNYHFYSIVGKKNSEM